jgi:hypothetical protein
MTVAPLLFTEVTGSLVICTGDWIDVVKYGYAFYLNLKERLWEITFIRFWERSLC